MKTVASSQERRCPSGSFFKLKIENGKLKINVGGVPPQSFREDSQIKRLHQMPEEGSDAVFVYVKS